MQLRIIFIIFCLSLLVSCTRNPYKSSESGYPPDNADQVTITQGVWGNIWFWEGDFMPTVSNSGSRNGGTITPVVREIYVYTATHTDSLIHDSVDHAFINKINSKFVAKLNSGKNGFFQVSLSPGKYSFFVKEGELFYGNSGDSDGHISAAQVETNTIVKRQIDITYNAAF